MHVEQRDVLYTEYYKMTSVTLLYYCLWFSILQLPFALTKLGECKSEQYTVIKATEYSFILSAVKNIQNC